MQCAAGSRSFRVTFFGTADETQGPWAVGYAVATLLLCYIATYRLNTVSMSVLCVHTTQAWQTRRTRNAPPEPVVDVGKGGPGWISMVYYAWHFLFKLE